MGSTLDRRGNPTLDEGACGTESTFWAFSDAFASESRLAVRFGCALWEILTDRYCCSLNLVQALSYGLGYLLSIYFRTPFCLRHVGIASWIVP